MKIKYSEVAFEDLKRFDNIERQIIAKKIHYLADNFDLLTQTKKVTQLKGTKFQNQYRYIVNRKIRIIFRTEENNLIILILRIGRRKNIYE